MNLSARWRNNMAEERLARTAMLIGEDAIARLNSAKILLFGVGGVGGYAAEALVRSGIMHICIVDNDTVAESNLNRQIIATTDTIGMQKTLAAANRLKSISPQAEIECRCEFFLPENADTFDFSAYDYVIDAVDTVTAKLEIITRAKAAGTPVISAMGAGNKLDAGGFRIADIYETSGCPLARVMRRELRARKIDGLKVVYSPEKPIKPAVSGNMIPEGKRQVPGSIAYAPAIAGLMIAAEVIKDIGKIV